MLQRSKILQRNDSVLEAAREATAWNDGDGAALQRPAAPAIRAPTPEAAPAKGPLRGEQWALISPQQRTREQVSRQAGHTYLA